jgi:gliding motility-associated-like protein
LTVTSNQGCIADTVKKFTVNGAVPKADFIVNDIASLCSNKQVKITNRSTVDFGNITHVEIFWDYANDPTDKTTNENPVNGDNYFHKYPEFGTPVSRDYQLVFVAYSGINCISEIKQKITVQGTPKIDFKPFDPVCEEVTPFALVNANDIYQYAGVGTYTGAGVSNSGMFNPSAAKDGTHTIRYTFRATNGCIDTAEEKIVVLPTPAVNAGADRYLLEGESITIDAKAEAGNTYLWLPEVAIRDNDILNPLVSPVDDIVYRLQVTSPDGCVGSDEVKVVVLKKIKVPNIFSPNGDGINDTWTIEHLEAYPGATLEIFNRYGQQVYFSNGYSRKWDGNYNGKPLPTGTYYYVIDPKNGRSQMKGAITIIR